MLCYAIAILFAYNATSFYVQYCFTFTQIVVGRTIWLSKKKKETVKYKMQNMAILREKKDPIL